MENFTNQTIDLLELPKHEEVHFTSLHPKYWKVILIMLSIFFVMAAIGFGLLFYLEAELQPFVAYAISGYVLLIPILVLFCRLSFRKKAYAFRTHDVLFRYGIIAKNTTIIPYNRVQHIALREGLLSRFFGLAKLEIFTAGGSSSDILIPGIEKELAENIKQLLMGKIQKQL